MWQPDRHKALPDRTLSLMAGSYLYTCRSTPAKDMLLWLNVLLQAFEKSSAAIILHCLHGGSVQPRIGRLHVYAGVQV